MKPALQRKVILFEEKKESVPLHENTPLEWVIVKDPVISSYQNGEKTQLIIDSTDYYEVKGIIKISEEHFATPPTNHNREFVKMIDKQIEEFNEKLEQKLRESDEKREQMLQRMLKESDEKRERMLQEFNEKREKEFNERLKQLYTEKWDRNFSKAPKKRDFQYMNDGSPFGKK